MNTTTTPSPSSPPSFMSKAADREKIESAKALADKEAKRELTQQEKDEIEIRRAALTKATDRTKELVAYAEKIDKVIGDNLPLTIAKDSFGKALDLFILLEDQIKKFEEIGKALKERMGTAREVSFPERLEQEEMKTVTSSETGNRVSRTTKVFASIPVDAQNSAYDWLRKPVFFEPYTEEQEKLVAALMEQVKEGAEPESLEWPVRKPMHPYTLDPATGGIVPIEGLNDEELPTYSALIKPTVNASSLSSLAKELLGQGMEMPDGLFRVYSKDSVSITKGKAKT